MKEEREGEASNPGPKTDKSRNEEVLEGHHMSIEQRTKLKTFSALEEIEATAKAQVKSAKDRGQKLMEDLVDVSPEERDFIDNFRK